MFEKFVESWSDSDFANVSVEGLISDMNVKCFICTMVYGVDVSFYYFKILKFCFWVICRDVVVSDDTGGLISIVWNSFFQGPIGFTYVFSCAGWASPVIDYVSLLSTMEFNHLAVWVNTWWCWCLELCILLGYICIVHWGLWCIVWQLWFLL